MSGPADVSPELAALLRRGAEDGLGLLCRPGEIERNYAHLREAERLGYIRFIGIERPWITPAGRAAIGAPTEAQSDLLRRSRLLAPLIARKRLVPEKRKDPRTDFDYRSYRSMGYACTLAFRQPDARENPRTIRIGRSLTSDPQFLGPNNSIILPESEGRLVLALMPAWLIRRAGLSTHPLPIAEDDSSFTDAERVTWDRLRSVCYAVNSRIRNAHRRDRQNLRFGETA